MKYCLRRAWYKLAREGYILLVKDQQQARCSGTYKGILLVGERNHVERLISILRLLEIHDPYRFSLVRRYIEVLFVVHFKIRRAVLSPVILISDQTAGKVDETELAAYIVLRAVGVRFAKNGIFPFSETSERLLQVERRHEALTVAKLVGARRCYFGKRA